MRWGLLIGSDNLFHSKSELSVEAVEGCHWCGRDNENSRDNFGLGSIKRIPSTFGSPICEIRQQARLAITS